jgi:hypothetical protein
VGKLLGIQPGLLEQELASGSVFGRLRHRRSLERDTTEQWVCTGVAHLRHITRHQ